MSEHMYVNETIFSFFMSLKLTTNRYNKFGNNIFPRIIKDLKLILIIILLTFLKINTLNRLCQILSGFTPEHRYGQVFKLVTKRAG
jgi:hypothetical protein